MGEVMKKKTKGMVEKMDKKSSQINSPKSDGKMVKKCLKKLVKKESEK